MDNPSVIRIWITLEVCKFISFILILINPTTTVFWIAWVILVVTFISYYKSTPLLLKLIVKSYKEENPILKDIYTREKRILLTTLILDLLPIIPIIHSILRYQYYKLNKKLQIIKK